jgi:hypothetical protein
MSQLGFDDLYRLAVSVGFPPGDTAVTAAAVALAESGISGSNPHVSDPNAVGDPTFGGSYGLWQINHPAHPEYDTEALLDPTYNAKAALAVWQNAPNGGSNFTPWSTYNHGDYKQFVEAPPADAPTAQTLRTAGICALILAAAVATAYYIENGLPTKLKRALR